MKSKLFLLLLLTSCVRYTPDPVKTPKPDSWKGSFKSIDSPTPGPEKRVSVETATLSSWWTVYNDEKLDELVALAIKNSPTLRVAVGRLKEAEAYYGIARSEQFPHVDLDLSYQRQRLSKTSPFFSQLAGGDSSSGLSARDGCSNPMQGPPMANSLLPTIPLVVPPCSTVCPPPPTQKVPTHATTLTVLPTVSYEIDFWGKYMQSAASAYNMVKAESEDLTTALLIVTANVADSYLQLRTYDTEIAVLQKNYESRKFAYELQARRFKAGLIDELDLERATVQLTAIQADLEASKNERSNRENLLALLIGSPAPDFHISPSKTKLLLPQIPAAIPSSILENRPDIKSALYQIEAMRLQVGVKKTAYFPAVTLLGNYGYMANDTRNLFKWKSHVWSITADALTPIYTAGRIKSEIQQAIAQYEQSVSGYLQTVLSAYREVEDALGTVDAKKRQLVFLDQQVTAAQKVFTLSSRRYNVGLVDYLDVVTAETSMLESELQQVRVAREQYSATISLIKSLGGVWESNPALITPYEVQGGF